MPFMMLVHHQKSCRIGEGSIPVGEDGCPYADKELLIVCDGLGGRGGFPHRGINPEILDRKIFYSKFIEPVLGKPDIIDEKYQRYVEFVEYSFKELFELGERYFDGPDNMRTSGYFASRLVTAIVLHAIDFIPEFGCKKIFSELKSIEEDKRKEYIDNLRFSLAELIKDRLAKIAERMGLRLESRTTGSYLLPTTMVLSLMNETETGVEVLYLWAGDSRGYIWDKNGLAQITDDHEKGETMTNLISLTRSFTLEARMMTFSKPVMLLNVSDGCYKCSCFASAFDFEYVLLKELNESDNFKETAEKLDEQFLHIGTHDDSNTIALMAFGYDEFNDVKSSVAARLDYLNKEMVSKLPDILTRDYDGELDMIDRQISMAILGLKDPLIASEDVVRFIKEKMMSDDTYRPYKQERDLLSNKLSVLAEERKGIKKEILEWVNYYWIRFPYLKKLSGSSGKLFHGDSYEKFDLLREKKEKERREFIDQCTQIYETLNRDIDTVNCKKDDVLNYGAEENDEFKRSFIGTLTSLKDSVDKLIGILNDKYKGGIKFIGSAKPDDEINELAKRYSKKDRPEIENLAKLIFEGSFNVMNYTMPEECKSPIASYLEELKRIERDKYDILAEIEGLPDKHFKAYWDNNAISLIQFIQRDRPSLIPRELRDQIDCDIDGLQAKRQEIVEYLEKRTQIYDLYNYHEQGYYRYFKESEI